ncbi:MAG TPA: SAM-dependent methyltransferase [Acidimicrobiaceae bacterium]|nr:SAM-dependent methyltransferase [Acidimicrobiaceae bacterium]HAX06304.1 SAM-dependent methyltransferase [Acidimicrobiaceae bacterium]|tara:strand:- start:416 stop:1075 length:660 start_codon:yes stop_codon:yes gene_type:complete
MGNGESTNLDSSDDPRYAGFPAGFFDRADSSSDQNFYSEPRMVTHIDKEAIAAVGELYQELQLRGRVLDVMSSWVSHFIDPPNDLVALGMNSTELAENRQATSWVKHDLNMDPRLPFEDDSFDGVVCCVSVDYLVRPIEVFDEIHRCLKVGGVFVNSFSNRCFPTKAIRGWSQTDDRGHVSIVGEYYRLTGPWDNVRAELRTSPSTSGDPLFAVWGIKK